MSIFPFPVGVLAPDLLTLDAMTLRSYQSKLRNGLTEMDEFLKLYQCYINSWVVIEMHIRFYFIKTISWHCFFDKWHVYVFKSIPIKILKVTHVNFFWYYMFFIKGAVFTLTFLLQICQKFDAVIRFFRISSYSLLSRCKTVALSIACLSEVSIF